MDQRRRKRMPLAAACAFPAAEVEADEEEDWDEIVDEKGQEERCRLKTGCLLEPDAVTTTDTLCSQLLFLPVDAAAAVSADAVGHSWDRLLSSGRATAATLAAAAEEEVDADVRI